MLFFCAAQKLQASNKIAVVVFFIIFFMICLK
jgi:hypothetical protein